MLQLGKKVRDKITGFEGTLIGRASYLFGCDQLCVAPAAKDGNLQDSKWFDDGRLVEIGKGFEANDVKSPSNKPGGPDRGAPAK